MYGIAGAARIRVAMAALAPEVPLAFDGGARIDLGPAARPLVPERTIRRKSPAVDLTTLALAYLARPVTPMWPGAGVR